jgi:hypothetical protein
MDLNFDFSQTTEWKGDRQVNLNACLIAFSTLFVGLRLYVRSVLNKSLGIDDAVTVVAYVCPIAYLYLIRIHEISSPSLASNHNSA